MYDANSNILAIDTNFEDNAYRYDRRDRVVSDTIDAAPPVDYRYDLNDNRLAVQRNAGAPDARLRYSEASNRLASQETLALAASPFTPQPLRELVYNDVGRLYQLYEDGALKAEYLYNDQGQRTRKVIYAPAGATTTTIYHYDAMGYLVTETRADGTLVRDYIWQEGRQPLAQIDNRAGVESIVYLYADQLMTNRLATDAARAVVWRWEGEAFGNTPAQELAGVRVNLRFPGQYFDEETNLHYNRFRYYDPELGRYITSDPIGLNGGLNTYLYVGGNPINEIDPNGENALMIGIGVAAVAFFGYKLFELGEQLESGSAESIRDAELMADALSGDNDALNRIAESDKRRLMDAVAAHETAQDTLAVERGIRGIASDSPVVRSIGAARSIKEFIEELLGGDDSDDPRDCE